MIHEAHEHIPEGYRVSAPVVAPWEKYPDCPKCGHGLRPLILRWWLVVRGKQSCEFSYCRGDLNSTMKVPAMNLAMANPTLELIDTQFKSLLRVRHPDAGGSNEAMAELNQARAEALKEIGK